MILSDPLNPYLKTYALEQGTPPAEDPNRASDENDDPRGATIAPPTEKKLTRSHGFSGGLGAAAHFHSCPRSAGHFFIFPRPR